MFYLNLRILLLSFWFIILVQVQPTNIKCSKIRNFKVVKNFHRDTAIDIILYIQLQFFSPVGFLLFGLYTYNHLDWYTDEQNSFVKVLTKKCFILLQIQWNPHTVAVPFILRKSKSYTTSSERVLFTLEFATVRPKEKLASFAIFLGRSIYP
jgi:hypothetical protein